MLKTKVTAQSKNKYHNEVRGNILKLQTIIGLCFAIIVAMFWPSYVIVGLFYCICLALFKLVGR